MSKIGRDKYYMSIAHATALRGTCDRRQVGAVLVHNDRILATGFNGAPRGLPECDNVGHELVNGSCVRTIHAEINALMEVGGARLRALASQSHKFTRARGNAVTLYTTTSPCRNCMYAIINASVQRIVYDAVYADPSHGEDRSAPAFSMADELGIIMDPFVKVPA